MGVTGEVSLDESGMLNLEIHIVICIASHKEI